MFLSLLKRMLKFLHVVCLHLTVLNWKWKAPMKRLDMTGICVVFAGECWAHDVPPCSREMVPYLERNERLVSWLQPIAGGVHDQVPAIRVNDAFYTISLRMMKAIWRHVRLRKGFDNVERAPYGGLKLKIPVTLLAEKLRTQSRFNVSPPALVCLSFPPSLSLSLVCVRRLQGI
jgi:hypothetical protein